MSDRRRLPMGGRDHLKVSGVAFRDRIPPSAALDPPPAVLTTRVNFNHRDESAYTDNNRGRLNAADMLDASIGLSLMDQRLRLSVFGKNLLDEVTEGNDAQLPNTPAFGGAGATYSPLNKGRVYGIELNYKL